MNKLVYGKNKQLRFNNEEEKKEAIDYILNSNNVDFKIHENNQLQGAWGPEDRIHFKKEEGVPECLKRNMTAGNGGLYGRINCKEFCDEIRELAKRKNNK
ncbi:hypothetical protein DWZ30_06770 [Coprobacillus sp. AF31-1BH]|jgi:hypothetical protein|nr:hypothetical protein DWZ30_06770 [Coprobacillus sp. AF31-1BH]